MSQDPHAQLLGAFNADAPRRRTIRHWATALDRGATIGTETDTEALYLSQTRRWLRGLGPPPRDNAAAQAAWSDVVAALWGT